MLKAATELKAAHPNLSFVIPIAPTIKKELIDSYLDKTALEVTCVNGQMREVINCCHSAIVASGTACLEVALLQTPMAIIYKASPLTYAVAMKVIKMRYFGLCNLLAGKMVVPELLQTDLTPETIFEVMNRFLCDKTHYQKTKQELKLISKMLENNTADCTLGTLVLNMLTFSTKTTKEAAIRC
jgi:lipid-A-disaccharide synthase